MEPITATALISASVAVATAVASGVSKHLIKDGYDALKDLIKKRFGAEDDLVKAIDLVESDPNDENMHKVLHKRVEQSGAEEVPEILEKAEELAKLVQQQSGGESVIQNAQGNYIAQANNNSTATVHINLPKE